MPIRSREPYALQVRIGVIGHVEHITLGRVPKVPRPGEIAHLEDVRVLPGGGGGITFFQLVKSDAEIHLFTALGNDEAAELVEEQIRRTGATIHAARREERHTRDLVMIDPDGERTIVVVGQPLHPTFDDPLPWDVLADLDAVYFTAQDPRILERARRARLLLATARRRRAIDASKIRLDVIIGSRFDAQEMSALNDYEIPPAALVMTAGLAGGIVETSSGAARFETPKVDVVSGAYGAGDSFAGALTYYVASGLNPLEAAGRAAEHGAAVLESIDPLDAQRPLKP